MHRSIGIFGVSLLLGTIAAPAAAQDILTPRRGATQPGKDRGPTAPSDAPPPGAPRVPWRGSALKWSQAVTTTTLGVGSDVQGASQETYSHGYWALLNYYLISEPEGKLRVATSPGFDVELTNSDLTTREREPLLRDLNLSFIGIVPFVLNERGDTAFTLVPNATALFPTSKLSRATSTQFVSSPRLTAALTTPFLRDSDFPKVFSMFASLRWDHRFTEAEEPTNAIVEERPRTSLENSPVFSDQLSGVANAHDVLQAGGAFYFYGQLLGNMMDLTLAASWGKQYLYTFPDVTVMGAGGVPIPARGFDDAQSTRTVTSFAIEWGYYFPEIGFSIGYDNTTSDLGPDGQRRSIFYSPAAVFTTQLILSIDAMYEGFTGPRRTSAFILPG